MLSFFDAGVDCQLLVNRLIRLLSLCPSVRLPSSSIILISLVSSLGTYLELASSTITSYDTVISKETNHQNSSVILFGDS